MLFYYTECYFPLKFSLFYFSQTLSQLCVSIVIYLQVIAFLNCLKVVREFTFLIYLSMPIDNVTWQTKVGIFFGSKSLFKSEAKNATTSTQSYRILCFSFLQRKFIIFIMTSVVQSKIFQHYFVYISSKQQILLVLIVFYWKIYYLIVLILKKILDLNIHL